MNKPDSSLREFYDRLADYKWPTGFVCRKCGNKTFTTREDGAVKRCNSKKCKNSEESVLSYTAFHKQNIDIRTAYDIIDYYLGCSASVDMEEKALGRMDRPKLNEHGNHADVYNKGQFVSVMDFAKETVNKNEVARIKIANNLKKMDFKSFREANKLSDETIEEAYAQIEKNGFSDNKLINDFHIQYLALDKEIQELYLEMDNKDAALEKKVKKYAASKTPTIRELSEKFGVEKKTVTKLLNKLCSRLEILNPSSLGRNYTFMEHLQYSYYLSSTEQFVKDMMQPIYT